MAWFDDLNSMPDVGSVQQFQAPQKRMQQPKKKKGFLLDQISTAGGILGGIGGSFIAPIAGTAGGAAAGSALGETLENALMGESLGKNVAKEAALGGIFSAGPLRLGSKVISKVAPRAGRSLEQGGKNLLGTQANLTRAQSRQLGSTPQDVLGEINQRTGLTNINKMADVGKSVTGESGVFSELTRNAIGNTKGVDIGDLRTVAEDLFVNKAPLVTGAAKKNVVEQVKNSAVKSYGGAKGSLSTLADPYEAFDVARGFEANAARLRSAYNASAADKQLADVYTSLAKEVNQRLFSAPGVVEGLIAAKPAAVTALKQLAKSAPSRSEKNAYTKLAQELGAVKTVKDARTAQSAFVKLSNIDQATAQAQSGAGAQLGSSMQGLGKILQRPSNLLAVPLNAATPAVGGGAVTLGRALQGGMAAPTAKGIAGRVGAAGVVSGTVNQSAQQTGSLEGALASQDGMNETPFLPDGISGPLDSMTKQPVEQSPYPRENLIADVQRDPKNAEKYIEYFTQLQSVYAPPEQSKFTSSTAGTIADMQKGLQTIDDLKSMVSGGEFAGGVVRGGLRKLNPFDSTYRQQQAMVDTSRQIVGKAMEGGVLRKEDEEKYKRILPTMQDPPEVALSKLNYIQGVLSQNLQQYSGLVGAGTAPTTIEEAMLQYQ